MPRENFEGKPVGYKVSYISSFDDGFQSVSVNYMTNTATLTNLYVNTKYFIVVAAMSSTGEGHGKSVDVFTGENRLLLLSCSVN